MVDLQFIAFAPHGLDEDRQVQLSTAGHQKRVRGVRFIDAQRDIGLQFFIEAIAKVVRCENADTILRGEIKSVRKRVLIQTPENEPRQIETALTADVEWRDNRALNSGALLASGFISALACFPLEVEPDLETVFADLTAEFWAGFFAKAVALKGRFTNDFATTSASLLY